MDEAATGSVRYPSRWASIRSFNAQTMNCRTGRGHILFRLLCLNRLVTDEADVIPYSLGELSFLWH